MNQPIRIGLVGIGRAGYAMHTAELASRRDKFCFTAGCDCLPERVEAFANEFGAKAYTNIEDLVQDPNVDLVDIATLSCDHFAHAKTALLAGKDVFLEKPFAMNTAEAEELIRLGSQPHGPHLYIRHNRRFEYGFEMVSNIIASGLLGQVFEVKLTRNGYQRRNDWQTLKAYGGGQICNWGPHIIDHALQFCGGDYEQLLGDLKQVAWLGDRDDHVKIVFKGVNGCVVDMEISGGAAVPTPEYIVYGSRGGLVSEAGGFRLRYLDPAVELPAIQVHPEAWPVRPCLFSNPEQLPWVEEFRPLPQEGDGTPRIWDALYDTLRLHKPFPITSEQALKVIRVIERVRKDSIF